MQSLLCFRVLLLEYSQVALETKDPTESNESATDTHPPHPRTGKQFRIALVRCHSLKTD